MAEKSPIRVIDNPKARDQILSSEDKKTGKRP
jgi:hypothetical protein